MMYWISSYYLVERPSYLLELRNSSMIADSYRVYLRVWNVTQQWAAD